MGSKAAFFAGSPSRCDVLARRMIGRMARSDATPFNAPGKHKALIDYFYGVKDSKSALSVTLALFRFLVRQVAPVSGPAKQYP